MTKAEALAVFIEQKRRLAEIAESVGLHLEMFGIVITDDDNLCEYQTQFVIRPEAVMSEAEREQATIDAQFAQIERSEKEREMREEQIPKTIASIDEWLAEDNE